MLITLFAEAHGEIISSDISMLAADISDPSA